MQTTRVALEAHLSRVEGVWRLDRIAQQLELPAAARLSYPEQQTRHPVTIEVLDAKSPRPIPSRVHIEDDQGVYWAPEGHMRQVATGWREEIGHDVVVAEKTWAYVPGLFRTLLPKGSYVLEVMRGPEYTPTRIEFQVDGSSETKVRVELERWSDVRRQGWYAGDTHVHFVDPEAALLEAGGEDLHVLNILASKWGALLTNVEHFIGRPSPSSQPDRIVYVGEETRHGWLGHSILLGIEELVYPLTWGGPSEGVPGGFDHPPMATQADAAHVQGGFVAAAHFPWPNGELAVDIALGKLDSIDVLTWADAFSEKNAMPAPPPIATWYRYLNCGFDLPATAGTDKMYNTQVSGSVRVYAKVDGAFDYATWIDALRAGRTFVTTAPMLELTVDGHGIGDTLTARRGQTVRIVARSRSRIPVAHLEVVAGGKVVARVDNPERQLEIVLETDLPVDGSTWLAARAYSPEKLPYQAFPMAGLPSVPVMAHTSPIYISVDGQPRRSASDARVLLGWVEDAIDWARSKGRFASEKQREDMITLFKKARTVYQSQITIDRH
jgi:hypothetical protein